MNEAEIRDIYLKAKRKVDMQTARALAKYYAPDLLLQIALMAGNLPQQQHQLLDPNVREALVELYGKSGKPQRM